MTDAPTREAEAAAMLFNPFAEDFRADPYPTYAKVREAGAALRTAFGATLVTRYEEVDHALKSPLFRTPRGYRDPDDPAGPGRFHLEGAVSRHRRLWLLFQTGELHGRLRRLIMKVFTPRAVNALAPRIEGLVDTLLERRLAEGRMEVIADFAYPLPATVICELLGIPESDRDINRAWATKIAPTLEVMISEDQVADAEKAMTEWDAYIRSFLAERRKRSGGDTLIDAMLSVEDAGARLSEDEIVANATFLFMAGHETTTNLIGNGLLALLRNPDQLAILRAEPARLEGAIEELLRYDSPVQFAGRVPVEPVDIAGVRTEPGMNVMLALGCANHDPRRFERPDALDVTRADPKPLSFGGGAHYCIGAALARLEARIAFRHLLDRTKTIEASKATLEKPAWRPSMALRGLVELPIELRT